MRTPVTIGVVGLGHWGPNLARAFDGLPQAELTWLCDARADVRLALAPLPQRRMTADYSDYSVTTRWTRS